MDGDRLLLGCGLLEGPRLVLGAGLALGRKLALGIFLVSQEFGVYSLERYVSLSLGLFNAIGVGLVGAVVCTSVLLL